MKKLLLFLLSSHLALSAEFIYIQSDNALEKTLTQQDQEITLLSWNLLGLPNYEVAIRRWEERVDAIAQKIISSQADVVVLQESFEPGLSLGLFHALKTHYKHFYLHLESDHKRLTSGLALFSKLPVEGFSFQPHPDLLDGDAQSEMGIIDFYLVNEAKKRVAHIAASHFLGSSNCEWRHGKVKGEILSYAQIREEEAQRALNKLKEGSQVPTYLVGDLNVDTRSLEFTTSSLNAAYNPDIQDPMPQAMRLLGTNTNFWKHERGFEAFLPKISREEAIGLTLSLKRFYKEVLRNTLQKSPWDAPLAALQESLFSDLRAQLVLEGRFPEKRVWDYFVHASKRAVLAELKIWKDNDNKGINPPVSIGRVIAIRALPIDESLDYILGTNSMAKVSEIQILRGYEEDSEELTLSDHHPLKATLHLQEET